ncbi:UDP-3-O-(3-hydroxymyristoyl) N-acetylglucosamine deacetylase [Thalassoporum mexicanum PCC 7367]|uniref:UDP-3-O-acyl-N-acetylglucosamine deacetylase n=1 Tax=Thalassoporum mexicanum TaxID=3457544 RepID=UPI00029FDA24|nr:UDP-3-O-acyl-N-acetylglucosamine deacetylase [Pseudanabaena sp. PCC 7367]AFY70583.1 UDP-3-O-(3-hydroxymyristoyl) N-acetylglucosamine deacetylase [Pseudanabaena sp. PCC 7367]
MATEQINQQVNQQINQQTIANPFSLAGVGLHSGAAVKVEVNPAKPDTGRYFVQGDRQIPASLGAVTATVLSTQLQIDQQAVRTVEHLLAALVGMGIDNAEIRINSAELPILDGSALPWAEAIARAGITTQPNPRSHLKLNQVISVTEGDSFVVAVPAPAPKFTYGIEFPTQAIGSQWFTWSPDQGDFAKDIAPARTFTMAALAEQARAAGLIKGGSLENAIVCDQQKWLNPPLRFENEPCRHKMLDLIGDLSLLGSLPQAHVVAYKASHHLHTKLAKVLSEVS